MPARMSITPKNHAKAALNLRRIVVPNGAADFGGDRG
jgi:hypothetical protein